MPLHRTTLAVLSLVGASVLTTALAHDGVHPTHLDIKEDAILQLTWFKLVGGGIEPGPEQDPLEPQEYKIINSSPRGEVPMAVVKIAWALGAGHEGQYSDYTAIIRTGTTVQTYAGNNIPGQVTINPQLDGWRGVLEVELRHRFCDLVYKARAPWNLTPQPCNPCQTLSCPTKTRIESDKLGIDVPVGPAWYGAETVDLALQAGSTSNPGPAKLALRGRSGDQGADIVELNGVIQSAASGGQLARVIPSPTTHDPRAFEIHVSSDPLLPEQSVFRITRIENPEPAGGPSSLRVQETMWGRTSTREFTRPTLDSWALVEDDLRRTTRTTISETTDSRVWLHHVEERDSLGEWQTVEMREEEQTMFSWGWETTRETTDPDGRALTTTWEYYRYDQFSGPQDSVSGRGQLSRVEYPTGFVRSYEYHDTDPLDDSFDRLTITREHFAGLDGARETRRHVKRTYDRLDERIESLVQNVLVSRTNIEARSTGGTHWRTVSRYDGESETPAVTRYEYENRPISPLAQKTIFPDGTVEEIHEIFTDDDFTRSVFTGVPNPASFGLPILTGEEVRTVVNKRGQLVQWEHRAIRDATAHPLSESVAVSHDTLQRPTAFDVYHGIRSEPTYRGEISYGCCGIASYLGADGLRRHRYYDGLGRLFKTHHKGLAEETVFDGLTTHRHRYPESVPNGLSHARQNNRLSIEIRDLAGITTSISTLSPDDASWVTTNVVTEFHPEPGIGRRRTTTLPAVDDDLGVPATMVEEWYSDGSIATVSGSLVANRKWQHAATSTGLQLTESLVTADGSPRETTTTRSDWLGRPTAVLFSGDADDDGQPDEQTVEYDLAGRPTRSRDPDGATTLFQYDLLNQSRTTALDLDLDGLIDPAVDEVRYTRSGLGADDSGNTTTWIEIGVIAADGSNEAIDRTEIASDGRAAWIDEFPTAGAPPTRVLKTPVDGQPGSWTHSVWLPDGTSLETMEVGGLTEWVKRFDADGNLVGTRDYVFDPWQRLWKIIDDSGPDYWQHHVAPLVDAVSARQVGGVRTDYQYDHRGRLTEIDRPDTAASNGASVENRRTISYWPHGGVRARGGHPGPALSFSWDHAHRLESMTTAGAAAPTTRWFYDPDRGWLTAKRYHGQDLESSPGPNFSHTAAGRPRTHTNARGIASTRNYDPGGRLTSLLHNDGTPGTTILARDHHGRPTQVTDAGGTSHIGYSATGQPDWIGYQPDHLLAGWEISSPRDTVGRLKNLALLQNGDVKHRVSYRYDKSGRLAAAESPRIGAGYNYYPNTSLVRQLAFSDPLGPVAYSTQSYDSDQRLDRSTTHNGRLGADFRAFADHKLIADSFGRIESCTLEDGTCWNYAYHPSGALAHADRARQDATLPGHRFRWEFDPRENLQSFERQASPSTPTVFQTDALDQLTSIASPGTFLIFGQAPTAQTVTVNGDPATRDGPFFHHPLTTPDPALPTLAQVIIDSPDGSQSGSLHFPPSSFLPAHDADGNLLGDGIFTFTWDAQNRLRQAETTTAATAAGIPYRRIVYHYDHRSRLFARDRFDTPGATEPAQSTRFLNAGWRCLGETNAGNQLTRSLAWGLDRGSQLHLDDPNSALLWIHDHTTGSRLVAHTDPQGHVAGLIDSHSRQPVARYHYTPFGQTLAASGPAAASNPWRFSSHYTDPDTDLIHFGYRWLHPTHQRWLSRDPLGESESPNLYAFAGNDPVNHFDSLGGYTESVERAGNFLNRHVEKVMGSLAGLVGTAALAGSAPLTTADEAAAVAAEWGLNWESGGTLAGAASGAVIDPLILKCEEQIENQAAKQKLREHGQEELYSEHRYSTEDFIDQGLKGAQIGGPAGALSSAAGPVSQALRRVKIGGSNPASKGRVLWTGGDEALQAATKHATTNNSMTLEMTLTGKTLVALTRITSYKYTRALWDKSATRFASRAEGPVHIFFNASKTHPQSTFARKELPEIIRKGNDVIYHPVN
jgi:RHS repeat-associated protein